MRKLIKYLETSSCDARTRVPEIHFTCSHGKQKFIRAAFSDGWQRRALCRSRKRQKTTLTAGIACATLDGPLMRPRAQTIIVASSFNQARICFDHIAAFMWEKYDLTRHPRNRWRPAGQFRDCLDYRPDNGRGCAVYRLRSSPGTRHCARPDPRRRARPVGAQQGRGDGRSAQDEHGQDRRRSE